MFRLCLEVDRSNECFECFDVSCQELHRLMSLGVNNRVYRVIHLLKIDGRGLEEISKCPVPSDKASFRSSLAPGLLLSFRFHNIQIQQNKAKRL